MIRALSALLPLYELTLIVATAWVLYGVGYGRGALRAYRRGMARQKAALDRQQRASDLFLDGLSAMQRSHIQMIREHHAEQLARLAKEHEEELDAAVRSAVAHAMTTVAPHPKLKAS